MSRYPPVCVKVWGEFACFTRPEMKVERVSYDVMTPSAARGILEAIFWKPEFTWHVEIIEVLKPIRRISLLRNEVKTKASGRGQSGRYFADDDRTQRHTLALRDVAYVIRASVALRPHGSEVDPAKYRDQFRRRVARGQCYRRPCLGCREFAAEFGEPSGGEQPIDVTTDMGRMLFDIRYTDDESGRGDPVFFNGRLEDGVLNVPQDLYERAGGQ